MTPTINVVSFDPSLRNWGIAFIEYSPNSFKPLAVDIIQTAPLKETKLSKAQEDMLCIDTLIQGIQPCLLDADVIVVELPTGSQNSRGAVGYGICLALVASLPLPCLYVTPNQVKKVVGTNTATKDEIIDWVNTKHPGILPKNKSKANHQADAIVAAYAAEPQLRKFYETIING